MKGLSSIWFNRFTGKKRLQEQKALGLFLSKTAEGDWQGSGLMLTRQGKRIEIAQRWPEKMDLSQLLTKLPTNLPVALSLDGKGILHKHVPSTLEQTTQETLLQRALPGAHLPELCVQTVALPTGYYVSLLRRDSLDSLITAIQDKKLIPVHLSLGPFGGALLWQRLNGMVEEQTIAVGESFLEVGRESFKLVATSDIVEAVDTFRVGEEELPSYLLPAYTAALEVLLRSGLSPEAAYEPIAALARDRVKHKRIQRQAVSVLLFFLLLLLVNFLAFTYLNGQVSNLEVKTSKRGPEQEKLQVLERKLNEQESFLRGAGWLAPSRIGYYADRLAASVPPGIRLRDMSVFPVDEKRSKSEKRIVVQTGQMYVKGKCQEPAILEKWLEQLSQMPWIERLSSPDYQFGEREGRGEFSLVIHLRPVE